MFSFVSGASPQTAAPKGHVVRGAARPLRGRATIPILLALLVTPTTRVDHRRDVRVAGVDRECGCERPADSRPDDPERRVRTSTRVEIEPAGDAGRRRPRLNECGGEELIIGPRDRWHREGGKRDPPEHDQ